MLAEQLVFFVIPLEEANRVLLSRKKTWDGCYFLMDVWHPWAGCSGFGLVEEGRWIHVFGLLVYLWCSLTYRAISNICGVSSELTLLQSTPLNGPASWLKELVDAHVIFVSRMVVLYIAC